MCKYVIQNLCETGQPTFNRHCFCPALPDFCVGERADKSAYYKEQTDDGQEDILPFHVRKFTLMLPV